MGQEFAMKIAHDVAMFENSVVHSVERRLRQRIGNNRMDVWFGAGVKWSQIGNNTIGIEVANPFVADCVSKMFRDDLQAVILETAGGDFGFQISHVPVSDSDLVSGPDESPSTPAVLHSPIPTNKATIRTSPDVVGERERRLPDGPGGFRVVRASASSHDNAPGEAAETSTSSTELHVDRLVELRRENEKRWDEYIPGDHNRLAHTAAQMVLERPGQINPLLIHGPSGTGKSHLAIGLAHKMRMMHRMRRVLVLTAEQFTIEYTESARGGGFANFRRKYRDVEAIVIDDIQFCLGKSGTLVELRNTIDMLLREKRQIILVADRGLNELSGLGADLYARLSGGMACGVEPLDLGTRTKVLASICRRMHVELNEDIVSSLATQCSGDARLLFGVANRLSAHQRVLGRPLTIDEATRCTLDLIRACQPIVRISDIEKVVCEAFGLEDKVLREKSKCQSVSQPRMLAMFLARKYTRTALSEIGEYFGNRQHSTVISAQKKVEKWIETDDLIGCGRGQVGVREILKNLEATLQVG
jgi:chromosomal replication initiator protein